jgi:hypothetical protein
MGRYVEGEAREQSVLFHASPRGGSNPQASRTGNSNVKSWTSMNPASALALRLADLMLTGHY